MKEIEEYAQELLDTAESVASEEGLAASIAIVDAGGILVAFRRMKSAWLVSVDAARRKAYTSVMTALPTAVFLKILEKEPVLSETLTRERDFFVLGGGEPLRVDGKLLGGLGISGGHHSQDASVAAAVVARTAGFDKFESPAPGAH